MDLASRDFRKRAILSIAGVAAGSLIVAAILIAFVNYSNLSVFSISGVSMEPTLKDGQTVILSNQGYVEKDQITFFERPDSWIAAGFTEGDNTTFVKRVAATPGDVLEYDGTNFSVNGESIFNLPEHDYFCAMGKTEYSHTLSNDEFLLFGDNARASLDSRRVFCEGGVEEFLVPRENIVRTGHVKFQF